MNKFYRQAVTVNKKPHLAVFLTVCLVLTASPLDARPVWIQAQIGPETLWLEVAASPKTQQQGLMWRFVLPEQHGMLFVSANDIRKCMWMKNTPTPLDVAFINKHWEITNTHTMPAYTQQTFCSNQRVRYALEVNAGWFQYWQQRGLKKIELNQCLSIKLMQYHLLHTAP